MKGMQRSRKNKLLDSNNKPMETKTADLVAKKFEEAHAKNVEAMKKVVNDYSSSSEEEDNLNDEKIIEKIYHHYKKSAGETNDLGKTASFLETALHSGAATCLICIGSVKRTDSIWTCKYCYCFFHLNCIRRWSGDSVAQQKKQLSQSSNEGYYDFQGRYVPPKKQKEVLWCCPQCRSNYKPEEQPHEYLCFCGKEKDPQHQQFLVPHSCGNICYKRLRPDCGHLCQLLCHPGPCPPCPQYAAVPCLCKKEHPKVVRCIDKKWQCGKRCNTMLVCGKHICKEVCHERGKCPPCINISEQSCICGREKAKKKCSEAKWHCKNVCDNMYSCGLHKCEQICHAGPCGECPLSLPRTCPCGKTKTSGPCTEEIQTCGDTCQKLLSCGEHTCTQRCHHGKCNLCVVVVNKKCPCGKHQKEIPCSKEFSCDTKCKRMKLCGKHPCNRKCCNGECPPCEKICGKPLGCQKHKCQSVCHNGPCYPCKQQSQVNCRCGKTKRFVPCGRERASKIFCKEPCRVPSRCHHEVKHRCHKNECPPCSQVCGLANDTSGCGHVCEARCHAAVKVKVEQKIWEQQQINKKPTYRQLPHPQCEKKISVTCIGGHEVADWPCWNSKPTSCQRPCNRQLKCGNHRCTLICHSVADQKNLFEQASCQKCQEGCNVPRPEGCKHPCTKPCHPPPCGICQVNINSKCHCGLTTIIYKCSEYYNQDLTNDELNDLRERLKSCGNRCMKNFPCGHRCITKCHSGPCPSPDQCRKKLKIYCNCRRLKTEISCDKYRNGFKALECDQNCEAYQAQEAACLKEDEQRRNEAAQAKNRLELEQFERKFGKRKRKERKQYVPESKSKISLQTVGTISFIAVALVIALAIAYYAES